MFLDLVLDFFLEASFLKLLDSEMVGTIMVIEPNPFQLL